MKPSRFDYQRVGSLDDALHALASLPDARPLAGGQSLVPLMNLRLAAPEWLVDLNDVTELDFVRVGDDGRLQLGALCRHRTVEHHPVIAQRAPLLHKAAGLVAHPAIRTRGTLGGSLAHADPAAEFGAALLALAGSVTVASVRGVRTVPAAQLWTGVFTTSLDPDELVTAVDLPPNAARHGSAFVEFAPRHGDFATAGVGVDLALDAAGACAAARGGGCGLSSTPVDLTFCLEPLLGDSAPSPTTLREIARRAGGAFAPIDDVHASAADRQELASLLLVQAVREAWNDAREEAV